MFEALLQQTPAAMGDLTPVILGALVTLLPTISIILKQWQNGNFARQQLAEKGQELRDVITSEASTRKAADSLACIVSQLIVANNDGKITQQEYDQIIASARTALIEQGRAANLDVDAIVTTAERLMQKRGA